MTGIQSRRQQQGEKLNSELEDEHQLCVASQELSLPELSFLIGQMEILETDLRVWLPEMCPTKCPRFRADKPNQAGFSYLSTTGNTYSLFLCIVFDYSLNFFFFYSVI